MEGSVIISTEKLEDTEFRRILDDLPDEVLTRLSFSMPWMYGSQGTTYIDPDFGTQSDLNIITSKDDVNINRVKLQQACWNKAIENPQINTSVRGSVGRINGYGFDVSSDVQKIQEAIDEIEYDPRNRLYLFYPKFTGRAIIEGELHLCFTCHDDGFIEIDFIDPALIQGAETDGIIYHPNKALFPLIYEIDRSSDAYTRNATKEQIPSIFLARYPDLLSVASTCNGFNAEYLKNSRNSSRKFKKLGGFNRFIVAWDRSFITRRNVSHLRTTLKWLNYYENLKEYEIDHKKSSGAYLWVITITDAKAFRMWLSMTDAQRSACGISAKKTPGSTMVLPPGMTMVAVTPNLPKISGTDTDIMDMAQSGLNEPSDVTMGTSQSPFASVKASRGPMSDRTADEICWYEKFLRHDFWGSIFFLKSAIIGFPETFKTKEAVNFKKTKEKNKFTGEMDDKIEPIFENVSRKPEHLIEINFPTSEVIDAESRARAFLGVKHGSTNDVLGIPNSEIAKKLGFGNYRKMRLNQATEAERFPNLVANMNAEAMQEKLVAEPPLMNKPGQGGNSNGNQEKGQGQEKGPAKKLPKGE